MGKYVFLLPFYVTFLSKKEGKKKHTKIREQDQKVFWYEIEEEQKII